MEKYLITKILISTKLSNPICKTWVLKLVFITTPCLQFWAMESNMKVECMLEIKYEFTNYIYYAIYN